MFYLGLIRVDKPDDIGAPPCRIWIIIGHPSPGVRDFLWCWAWPLQPPPGGQTSQKQKSSGSSKAGKSSKAATTRSTIWEVLRWLHETTTLYELLSAPKLTAARLFWASFMKQRQPVPKNSTPQILMLKPVETCWNMLKHVEACWNVLILSLQLCWTLLDCLGQAAGGLWDGSVGSHRAMPKGEEKYNERKAAHAWDVLCSLDYDALAIHNCWCNCRVTSAHPGWGQFLWRDKLWSVQAMPTVMHLIAKYRVKKFGL